MKTTRSAILLISAGLFFAISAGAATVPETAADNDMDPCFFNDGWTNSVGSYDCIQPPSFVAHVFLTPPDGNNYGGGVQFAGVPGTQETIEKNYTNLVNGQVYAVEWYVMTDTGAGTGPSAEAWFDVTLCADQKETLRLVPGQRRMWIQQSLLFTANATTCNLSFRARNTLGDNESWMFLDGVAIGALMSSDLSITKTGPPQVSASGGNGTYVITVVNNGPDATGGPLDVTDSLPAGVSINGGAAGAVTLGGSDAGDWTCSSDAGVPQTISCTSSGSLANSANSTFSFTVDFAAGNLGDVLTNTVTVAPSFGSTTQDGNAANDAASSATTLAAATVGIPTLGEWGLVLLILFLATSGVFLLRTRRSRHPSAS